MCGVCVVCSVCSMYGICDVGAVGHMGVPGAVHCVCVMVVTCCMGDMEGNEVRTYDSGCFCDMRCVSEFICGSWFLWYVYM